MSSRHPQPGVPGATGAIIAPGDRQLAKKNTPQPSLVATQSSAPPRLNSRRAYAPQFSQYEFDDTNTASELSTTL